MKKLLTLLFLLVLMISLATPVRAAYQGDGGTLDSSAETENSPPVIDAGSLVVQIVDDAGTAWGMQGGTKIGDRAAPYVFEGEKLHAEMDVSDSNGEVDLNGMKVDVTLASGVAIICNQVSITIDPANKVSKARYSGDLLIDASIAQGKYDITITAVDPGGATGTLNPELYQPGADVLAKPTVTLGLTKSTVTFPAGEPGALNIAAAENPIVITPQAVIGEDHVPVTFTLTQSGTDMDSVFGKIAVNQIVWSLTDQAGSNGLADSSQTIVTAVGEGQSIQVYYWLNIPFPQTAGAYTGKINYKFIAD